MLSAFVRAFKTPDLRRKILFTLAIMAIYRLGTHVPSPGVDYQLVQQCLNNAELSGNVQFEMGFRLLVGREGLAQGYAVDPSRSYVGGRPPVAVRRRNRGR